jgi:hypothetical protein
VYFYGTWITKSADENWIYNFLDSGSPATNNDWRNHSMKTETRYSMLYICGSQLPQDQKPLAFVIRFRSSLIIAMKRATTFLVACYSLRLLSLLCVCVFHISELHIEVKYGVYRARHVGRPIYQGDGQSTIWSKKNF